jgi:hypothetical protein
MFDPNVLPDGSAIVPKDPPVDRSRSDLLGPGDLVPGRRIAVRVGIQGTTDYYTVIDRPHLKTFGLERYTSLWVKVRPRRRPWTTELSLGDIGVVAYPSGRWNPYNCATAGW